MAKKKKANKRAGAMAKTPEISVKSFSARKPVPAVEKARTETQLNHVSTVLFRENREELCGHKEMVDNSAILPQCINAYANNIAGFGIDVKWRYDLEPGEERTQEMLAEWERAEEVLSTLTVDMDVKELFEDVVRMRETYGIAYVEVIRNELGDIVELDLIHDVPSVAKSKPLDPYIDTEVWVNGKAYTRPKRFIQYRQQIEGQTVYFKEIGDARVMDKNTGRYAGDPGTDFVKEDDRANEIMEFTLGTKTYGQVRWTGQVLGVQGSRKADNLNNNYFKRGRHVPMAILVNGGELTKESETDLQRSVEQIEGEEGQFRYLVIQAKDQGNAPVYENNERPPKLEIKSLVDTMQKDALFVEYMNSVRENVQSAFLLPDLYVGYTKDFNQATATAAQQITEHQVFVPERKSLSWQVNNRLLGSYRFQHVEVEFIGPALNNMDDTLAVLNVAERAGGLTPNMAKQLAADVLSAHGGLRGRLGQCAAFGAGPRSGAGSDRATDHKPVRADQGFEEGAKKRWMR